MEISFQIRHAPYLIILDACVRSNDKKKKKKRNGERFKKFLLPLFPSSCYSRVSRTKSRVSSDPSRAILPQWAEGKPGDDSGGVINGTMVGKNG